jgi:hypothetical protein
LAAPVSNLRLAAAALPPARPRANPPARIGVFSPGSTGGKHPAFTVCYALPTDWRLTFQLALVSVLQLGLRLLPTHIWRRPSARLVSNLGLSPWVVATFSLRCLLLRLSSLRWRSPVCHTGREPPTRIGCSSTGFTGLAAPGLRRAPLPPAGPLMHPLLQLNLASPAEPSMSIPYPPVRAPSGSASLTTSALRRLLQSLAQPAIPLRLSPQVSPSGWAGGDFPILIGFSCHQPFRRPTPDALLAIS